MDNPEFRCLVNIINSQYPVPGRMFISKELDKVLITLKGNVHALLSQVCKVLTFGPKRTDLKLLGSTLLYQNGPLLPCGYSLCEKNAAQNVRVVIEAVLHKLSHDQISVITTDRGSNMVTAFCSHVEERAVREEGSNAKEQEKRMELSDEEEEEEEDKKEKRMMKWVMFCKEEIQDFES